MLQDCCDNYEMDIKMVYGYILLMLVFVIVFGIFFYLIYINFDFFLNCLLFVEDRF